ncbi:MAG: cyclic pyranopterin monophosphate synthase MoaC [Candidatus Zixiibacteriota bacterium]|nr:MAG: cyclic pyranopterin monophosphate synthase MoaC [candidate division Zixibacteria bacterium]
MKKGGHWDEKGEVRMVDVGEKKITKREAKAHATVKMSPDTMVLVREGKIPKGDVLGCAKIAGILAAKNTQHMIPMCHPLPINWVDLKFTLNEVKNQIDIESEVRVEAKTGVEMEALAAVAVSALTIYDMCKGIDKEMEISEIHLLKKAGGRSGTYKRKSRG